MSGKSKDEQMAEKKHELEKRLQDVSGQLGTNKKQQQKKGKKNISKLTVILKEILFYNYCIFLYLCLA